MNQYSISLLVALSVALALSLRLLAAQRKGSTSSGLPQYNNPIPVAVALIPLEGGETPALLGVVRGNEPGRGGTALPGGYVDEGESIEMAAAREVKEECGLVTRPEDWEVVCSRIAPNNRVLVFCALKKRAPTPEPRIGGCILPVSDEVLSLATITPETTLVFPTHQEVARAFMAGRRP